jgi:hypothetical protein
MSSLIQVSKKPFTQLIKFSAPNSNIALLGVFSRNQSTKTSEVATEDKPPSPYSLSPFKVPFSNKAEWAVARVDDILNSIRRVND